MFINPHYSREYILRKFTSNLFYFVNTIFKENQPLKKNNTYSILLSTDIIFLILLQLDYKTLCQFFYVNKYYNKKIKTNFFRGARYEIRPLEKDSIAHNHTIEIIHKIKNSHVLYARLNEKYINVCAYFNLRKDLLQYIVLNDPIVLFVGIAL